MSPDKLLSLGFSKELVVLIISALPLTELRGALPVGINLFHLPWFFALGLAIIGNLLPVPFLLLFFKAVSRILSRIGIFAKIFHWLSKGIRRRGRIIERYERMGLMLLVAIPLPGTGAWTGAAAAALFGIKFRHAILYIFMGIVIAGAIITSLSLIVGLWL